MNKKQTEKALRQLNQLYRHYGTWVSVARAINVNRATINKWFAGTRHMSYESASSIRWERYWRCGGEFK